MTRSFVASLAMAASLMFFKGVNSFVLNETEIIFAWSPIYCQTCCGPPPCCSPCRLPSPLPLPSPPVLCLTCCGPPPCCNTCGLLSPVPCPPTVCLTCCGPPPCCSDCGYGPGFGLGLASIPLPEP